MSNARAFTTSALPLEDQIVLVTGAGRGLGAAIAKAFAHEGSAVVVNYRYSAEAAEELAESIRARGGRAVAIEADVTDSRAVDAMVEAAHTEFGAPISTVVNSALVDFSFNGDERQPADEIDYSDFADQFRGTVEAALNTIQAAMSGFREIGSGRVINIGSNLVQNPVVPYHDYTAAKSALLSLTRTFARDLGPIGVRVNMVSGGLLRTTDASSATPAAVFDQIAAATALGHVTTPEEFASAVVFFASPASRAVTGQNLIVDNGLVMG
ncbi:3-oxoacyl-[acyl-carrier protein] reductase [Brevibacterium sanguinis]|uniref:3-oxoacyl-[acyl-carrier protein] reductase n=2 Tax=Brevibacterium TaxID=1696 RepID=A0A366ILF1_9MICO|nr:MULTISPECIES: 3-oxoacyl-ACP reductase [Brevibacterium]RBP67026.1 3-oxoacyl-[acyl-carrier protein] reductase [Brevibacterium sanguinis]RBP73551.1 3-oxoacyl-[acyl-carrier protein] reductase [Brevibacterium celere]